MLNLYYYLFSVKIHKGTNPDTTNNPVDISSKIFWDIWMVL